MTYANRPDAGHALLTDADAERLAAEFDAAVEGAPKTWGPISRDLAREAAHGRARLAAKAADAAQRAENRALGDYFEDDDPIPGERDLSTTGEVQASLVEHQSIQRDAARDASFGASIEDELREVGPEPSDACPDCAGDGWLPVEGGDAYVECNCQAVAS